jgi:hypothetical protein
MPLTPTKRKIGAEAKHHKRLLRENYFWSHGMSQYPLLHKLRQQVMEQAREKRPSVALALLKELDNCMEFLKPDEPGETLAARWAKSHGIMRDALEKLYLLAHPNTPADFNFSQLA